MKYFRPKFSHYASYRMTHQGASNFIAPEGQANFIFDQLNPEMIQQSLVKAGDVTGNIAGDLFNKGRDDFAQLFNNTEGLGKNASRYIKNKIEGTNTIPMPSVLDTSNYPYTSTKPEEILSNLDLKQIPKDTANEAIGKGVIVGSGLGVGLGVAKRFLSRNSTPTDMVTKAPNIIDRARNAITNNPTASKVGAIGLGTAGIGLGVGATLKPRKLDSDEQTKLSQFSYMDKVSNFMGGMLGTMQRDNMFSELENLKEQNKLTQINSIQDPIAKQAALDKHNKEKNNPLNGLGKRFSRVMNTL